MNTGGELALRAIELVSQIRSAEGFVSLLAAEPWLTADETLADLDIFANAPEFAAAFANYSNLLRNAGTDPITAWERFSGWMGDVEAVNAELQDKVIPKVERLLADHDWDAAITLASEHVGRAEDYGQTITVGFLRSALGTALLHTTSGNHAENVEATGQLLESAAQIAPTSTGRAHVLSDLALAFASRVREDPRENIERAYELLKRVLEETDLGDEPKLRTTAQTNIAELLQRREEGDRVQNLREAEDFCLQALEWRSRARDLTDWAYTVLNLAATRELLAERGELDLSSVEPLYADVAAEAARLAPLWLAAHAFGGLARIAEQRAAAGGDEPDLAVLAAARTYLEQLTTDDEGAYLAQRPALMHAFRSRAQAANAPGRRGVGAGRCERPYSDPDYWAAFMILGA
ncbi:MAG: hypothetical protein WCB67_12115 [Solirubrobacteraceae bacterium]